MKIFYKITTHEGEWYDGDKFIPETWIKEYNLKEETPPLENGYYEEGESYETYEVSPIYNNSIDVDIHSIEWTEIIPIKKINRIRDYFRKDRSFPSENFCIRNKNKIDKINLFRKIYKLDSKISLIRNKEKNYRRSGDTLYCLARRGDVGIFQESGDKQLYIYQIKENKNGKEYVNHSYFSQGCYFFYL